MTPATQFEAHYGEAMRDFVARERSEDSAGQRAKAAHCAILRVLNTQACNDAQITRARNKNSPANQRRYLLSMQRKGLVREVGGKWRITRSGREMVLSQ